MGQTRTGQSEEERAIFIQMEQAYRGSKSSESAKPLTKNIETIGTTIRELRALRQYFHGLTSAH
jgi:hypothetical protein